MKKLYRNLSTKPGVGRQVHPSGGASAQQSGQTKAVSERMADEISCIQIGHQTKLVACVHLCGDRRSPSD
jgi:hypothetical protein